MVTHCWTAARSNRQRNKKLLEHSSQQEEAVTATEENLPETASPVKVMAVRLTKGQSKYGSTSGISNHQEMRSSSTAIVQAGQISCESLINKDNSDSIDFPIEKNIMEIDRQFAHCERPSSVDYQSQHFEPCVDGGVNTIQSILYMNELFSPEFDACTTTKMDHLLDHNIHTRQVYSGQAYCSWNPRKTGICTVFMKARHRIEVKWYMLENNVVYFIATVTSLS
ncbi:hypothetical protein SUGI_0017320 [Cryptomeria japonica]|nr:hypothetical protein SUGI_0017320 [Cryptomeria japonica]